MKKYQLLLSVFIVILASTVYLYSYNNLTPAGLSESGLLGNVETALAEQLPELDADGKQFIDFLNKTDLSDADNLHKAFNLLSELRNKVLDTNGEQSLKAFNALEQAATIAGLPNFFFKTLQGTIKRLKPKALQLARSQEKKSHVAQAETALAEPLPKLDADGDKFINMLKTRQYHEDDFPEEEISLLSNIRDRALKNDRVAIATILLASKIENLPKSLRRLINMAIQGIIDTQKMFNSTSIEKLEELVFRATSSEYLEEVVLRATNPEHLERFIYRMLRMSN